MKEILILDRNSNSLGIPREFFSSPFHAVLPGNTIYNEQEIWKLLKYDPEGESYYFEDQFLGFYSPYQPTDSNWILVNIRPILFGSTETFKFNTNWRSKLEVSDGSICFELISSASNVGYRGVLISISSFDDFAGSVLNSEDDRSIFFSMKAVFIAEHLSEQVVRELFSYFSELNIPQLSNLLLGSDGNSAGTSVFHRLRT